MLSMAQAHRIASSTPFAVAAGYEIADLGSGTATVTLIPEARHLRPGDVVAGPILMGMADLAFWIAAQTVVGEERMALTLEEKSAFLSPARGDLRCEAKVLKAGRRVIYGQATTYDSSGRVVAHHTLTYLRPDRQG